MQQKARHEVHIILGELTRGAPVRHPRRGPEVDEYLEVVLAALLGDVRRQRLAGGSLAQHPVTAGATLEVELLGPCELLLAERRGTRSDNLGAADFFGGRPLVAELARRGLRMRRGLGLGHAGDGD